jgi:hypothetical protein
MVLSLKLKLRGQQQLKMNLLQMNLQGVLPVKAVPVLGAVVEADHAVELGARIIDETLKK